MHAVLACLATGYAGAFIVHTANSNLKFFLLSNLTHTHNRAICNKLLALAACKKSIETIITSKPIQKNIGDLEDIATQLNNFYILVVMKVVLVKDIGGTKIIRYYNDTF